MKKILVTQKYGQLCNRLFMLSHLIAFSLENQLKLIVLNFDDYWKYFEIKKNYKNIYFVNNKIILLPIKVYNIFSTILHKFNLIKDRKDLDSILKSKKSFIIVNGWNLLTQMCPKYYDDLKSIFSFHQRDISIVDDFISKIKRESSHLIIGVHIRRRDYISWFKGKYYYEDYDYLRIMKVALQVLSQDIHFIICSDEKIEKSSFIELKDKVRFSNLNFIQDLILLSKCDMIIGPPSTFNAYASFIGKKPLYTIKDSKKMVNKSDFIVNDGMIDKLIE